MMEIIIGPRPRLMISNSESVTVVGERAHSPAVATVISGRDKCDTGSVYWAVPGSPACLPSQPQVIIMMLAWPEFRVRGDTIQIWQT